MFNENHNNYFKISKGHRDFFVSLICLRERKRRKEAARVVDPF